MKLLARLVFLLLFLSFITCKENISQSGNPQPHFSFNVPNESIGFIVLNDSVLVGSGFVGIDRKTVITAGHVLGRNPKSIAFLTIPGNKRISLKLKGYDLNGDIAFLEASDNILETPLPIASKLPEIGQGVFYAGFDTSLSKGFAAFNFNSSSIMSIGKTHIKSEPIEFIEFMGNVRPGYSGGPVFNMKGEVIATIVEIFCFDKNRVRFKPNECIDRAHSVISIKK